MMGITRTLEDYLSLNYRIVLTPQYGDWTATIPDLPGCIAVGETPQEALELIHDAKEGWLTVSFERGLPIPEPSEA